MMLDRTTPPSIRPLGKIDLTRPERRQMKNGIPLNIIRAGSQEVVRFDVLIGAGQGIRHRRYRLCLPTVCSVRVQRL